MRRREAYGILLVVVGLSLLSWFKLVGAITLLVGAVLVAYGFFTPRVRY